jgi:hypothetical protein
MSENPILQNKKKIDPVSGLDIPGVDSLASLQVKDPQAKPVLNANLPTRDSLFRVKSRQEGHLPKAKNVNDGFRVSESVSTTSFARLLSLSKEFAAIFGFRESKAEKVGSSGLLGMLIRSYGILKGFLFKGIRSKLARVLTSQFKISRSSSSRHSFSLEQERLRRGEKEKKEKEEPSVYFGSTRGNGRADKSQNLLYLWRILKNPLSLLALKLNLRYSSFGLYDPKKLFPKSLRKDSQSKDSVITKDEE